MSEGSSHILVKLCVALICRPGMTKGDAATEINSLVIVPFGRQHPERMRICFIGCSISFGSETVICRGMSVLSSTATILNVHHLQ